MSSQRLVRIGFTLVELLTVVGIIAVLLTLTAIFFPSFNSQSVVASGADTTAGALLVAKMRAKRDGKPTGLRLTVNSSNQCTQLTVIQQPDDFAVGRYTGPQTTGSTVANFAPLPSGPALNFSAAGILRGDYLELNGGGLLYEIDVVGTTTLSVQDSLTYHPLPAATSDVNTVSAGTNYRIIRAAQVLSAEPVINLPVGVIIDLANYPPYTAASPNPGLSNPVFHSGNYDVLFAPSGSLVGLGSTGPLYLVLRQADGSNVAPYSNDLTSYFATIIAVEPRTGFIAAHPVAPGPNPYAYTQDGQSSGM